jgi:outer membrane protein assembly factor BamB
VTSSGAVPAFRRPPLRAWLWTAGAVVVVVLLALLWQHSDARATSSTTAPAPAPVTGTPGSSLTRAWSVTADQVPEQVVQGRRVIVGSRHGITALDPATGHEVWHYKRSNARMCGLTATDGVAVAVFSEGGLCDQAVALRADTGVRAWNRNVDFLPSVRLLSTAGHVLAVARTGVVDLDPLGDNIRWRYNAGHGCRLLDVRPGTTGTALLQSCPGAPTQLRLLDGITGQQHWSHDVAAAGTETRLAGADWVVTAVIGDQLRVLSATDGTQLQAVPLPAGSSAQPAELAAGGSVVVWARGTVFLLDRTTGAVRWQGPALGLPGVQLGGRTQPGVVVPEAGAFVVRAPDTGAESGRFVVSGVPSGGTTSLVGPTVVYRLTGRVLGYR